MTTRIRSLALLLAALALAASGAASAQNTGSGAGDDGGGGKDGPGGMDIGAIGTKQTAGGTTHVSRPAAKKTHKAVSGSSGSGGKAAATGAQ